MTKKQSKSKIIIILVAVALIIGLIAHFSLNNNKKPIYVYSFYDGIVGMPDYIEGSNENSGFIVSDRVQTIMLSSTQTSLEVKVRNGQNVSKGDVLFTYDTTLSDLALNQKALEISETKLNLQTAKHDLEKINALNPSKPPKPPFDPTTALRHYDLSGKEYLAYYGDGNTPFNPMYVWLRSDGMLDQKFLEDSFEYLLDEDLPSGEKAQNEVYLLVHQTADDKNDGAILNEQNIKISRKKDATNNEVRLGYSFYVMDEEIGNIDTEKVYTKEEIALMKKEKLREINQLEFNVKVAEAEYNIMLKEADSGEVVSEYDGVITDLVSIDEAKSQNIPLMKVSGGGGYYISSNINELDLDNIHVGQQVIVNSWQSGQQYQGEVVEISKFPDANNYYGDGRNESFYPYKVLVSGEANFRDHEYVSLILDSSAASPGLYIDNAFMRTEGAINYVYVRNEEGKLEKRKIKVGRSLWGSYTQIISGITAEDWIAFPYGKDTKEGAPTLEGTAENLYGGGMMYGEY